jgi:hypothetical protein
VSLAAINKRSTKPWLVDLLPVSAKSIYWDKSREFCPRAGTARSVNSDDRRRVAGQN